MTAREEATRDKGQGLLGGAGAWTAGIPLGSSLQSHCWGWSHLWPTWVLLVRQLNTWNLHLDTLRQKLVNPVPASLG